MKKRIGFACKFLIEPTSKKSKDIKESERILNTSTTTVAWLNRQPRTVAEDKLWQVAKHNLQSVKNVLNIVKNLNSQLHMMRLSSDLLPMYTEPSWRYFWQQTDVKLFCEKEFADIGNLAKEHDIRLSFHPGQFCVLASENQDVVARSIDEFEYHVDMARYMGYGQQFQDIKINVHISGKAGPAGIRAALAKMTPEARNTITIENDEMSWGLDSSLELINDCALVLDIHHHHIHSGEYIKANDNRVQRVIDSWRGVRPVIHYSTSREDLLVNHCVNTKPDLSMLLEQGYKKSKLRAHSDFYWNHACNEWALGFLSQFDIMCESKSKNLASFALYDFAKQQNLL